MRIVVEGKSGEGKSIVTQELTFALANLGFEVEVHSYEYCAMRDFTVQEECLEKLKQRMPRIILEERMLPRDSKEADTQAVFLMAPPAVTSIK